MTNVVPLRKYLGQKEKRQSKNANFPQATFIKRGMSYVCITYVPRKEYLSLLDLKNAEARAQWTRKYFSGFFCEDARTPLERAAFAYWHATKLRKARAVLRGGDGC